MNMTPQNNITADLLKALSIAQAESESVIKKDLGGEYTTSTFSDVMDIVKPILEKTGLSITHFPTRFENGDHALMTVVGHKDGGIMVSMMPLPLFYDPFSNKKQLESWASAITVARKYSVMSALGMSAKEDEQYNADLLCETQTDIPKEGIDWLNKQIDHAKTTRRWSEGLAYINVRIDKDHPDRNQLIVKFKEAAANNGFNLNL